MYQNIFSINIDYIGSFHLKVKCILYIIVIISVLVLCTCMKSAV